MAGGFCCRFGRNAWTFQKGRIKEYRYMYLEYARWPCLIFGVSSLLAQAHFEFPAYILYIYIWNQSNMFLYVESNFYRVFFLDSIRMTLMSDVLIELTRVIGPGSTLQPHPFALADRRIWRWETRRCNGCLLAWYIYIYISIYIYDKTVNLFVAFFWCH